MLFIINKLWNKYKDIAIYLSKLGYECILVSRNKKALEELANKLDSIEVGSIISKD